MILIGYAILVTLTLLFIFKHKNKFILNEKSLHKQWLFWLAIIAPLVSGIYFGAGIWSEFSLRLDFKGFSNFFEISKFPFGILALSPILGAFVVSAHRSYQTDIQIKTAKKQLGEAQEKNKVDIYLSKKKSIYEQLGYIYDIEQKKIKQLLTIYSKAYINSNEYNDTLNKNFTTKLNDKIKTLIISLNDFLNLDKKYIFYNKKETYPTQYLSFLLNVEMKVDSLSNNYSDIKNYLTFDINKSLISYFRDLVKSDDEHKYSSILYSMLLTEIVRKTYDIINVTTEVFTALYPNKNLNTYITYLSNLYNIKYNIEERIRQEQSFFLKNDNGDKVATENQNNHE
ncbi:hypothetical protein QSH14_06195 [Proteus faecis]|uniref:Phage abortive infection protein n=1 Tax=Proteus faecis TaxID=2050967 RepID=A0AAW7CR07_9GAMM|nr:hypothetical protein [Proteus faecis]MDL5166680.1 hypothetical protein [Proteus faecis]MDL5274685.1 hypothetical protein [Proteus faecis]MDL5278234.1 hypothetical protein [Proteus faecis]MDL5307236.1 hypothetical protein [Proteus faecis]MDL5310792.1 hypothetical protein [Proteus faecis]